MDPTTPGAVLAALAGNVVPACPDEDTVRDVVGRIEGLTEPEVRAEREPYGEVTVGGLPVPAGLPSWRELPAAGWVGDALAALPLGDCSDRDLLDAAAVWERLAAWAAGQQARVIAEFTTRRPQTWPPEPDDVKWYGFPGAQPVDPEVDESAADELSVSLRIATPTATRRIEFARALALRLPGTLEGMCFGTVTASKAHVLIEQTEQLSAEHAALVEERVLPGIESRTRRQVYERARREIVRIDADAVRRRQQKAIQDRTVVFEPKADGMARLSVELPAPDAIAAYHWLDEQARAAKATGDGRSLDQLRADAFVDLVTARSTSVARKPLIQVLVPVATLAGGDGASELAGYGPIDADLARQLAADGTWQRLLTDPATGAVTDVGTRRYVPPAALKTYVEARDRTCRFPTCSQPARRCDLDHTRPYRDSSRTHPDNLGALCRRHHKLKDRPGSKWKLAQSALGRFTWTTPTGEIVCVDPDPPI